MRDFCRLLTLFDLGSLTLFDLRLNVVTLYMTPGCNVFAKDVGQVWSAALSILPFSTVEARSDLRLINWLLHQFSR